MNSPNLNTRTSSRWGKVEGFEEGSRAFLNAVMGYMAMGLVVTAVVAYITMSNLTFVDNQPQTGWWFVAAIVAYFVAAFALPGIAATSGVVAFAGFMVFSVLTGIILAPMVSMYTPGSVVQAFAISAIMFGGAATYGAVTKQDLSRWGRALLMALIGLLVVMVMGIFLHSTMLDILISVAAVVLFTALTAYDVQKLETMYNEKDFPSSNGLAVYGAMSLYLDFINLFIHLLRLFGGKK